MFFVEPFEMIDYHFTNALSNNHLFIFPGSSFCSLRQTVSSKEKPDYAPVYLEN